MLEKIKLLLGISDEDTTKDELINLLISNAKDYAVSFCGYGEYNSQFDVIVMKMVVEDYNRLGSEGISSKSFNGISESYTEDYSAGILNSLRRYKKIILL